MKESMDIGLIGLGVMGKNLVYNMMDKGYKVSVYNRTLEKTLEFAKELGIAGSDNKKVDSDEQNTENTNNLHYSTKMKPCETLEEMVESLKKPRVIFLLVQSGKPVDYVCAELKKYVTSEDVIVDLGNSYYKDTMRRCEEFNGIFNYIGCGISGGEEGARNGASFMPGGHKNGWPFVEPILKALAAKCEVKKIATSNDNFTDIKSYFPCCEWIGNDGAGHFVKTVHNGIEYGDMAIISEIYDIFRKLGKSHLEIIQEFEKLGEVEELKGYLMEIIVKILKFQSDSGEFVVDLIEDRANNKGTGIWCILAAMESNFPATLIADSVFSRMISNNKEKRTMFSESIKKMNNMKLDEKAEDIYEESAKRVKYSEKNGIVGKEISHEDVQSAMILAKAVSYVQGLNLIKQVSDSNNWDINMHVLCQIWKKGCIIRGEFLDKAHQFTVNNLFENSYEFVQIYKKHISGLRKVVVKSIEHGIPVNALSGCLSYLDALKANRSNGCVIQAMRDFFGAHGIRLIGENEDTHINWV
ncbi:6-phosphogluconate dehydrogenase, decarboxylating [Edhazardia aedis USNM 41457]|uniref:6-phosphogluconate dehydrogenase, decarboxylating n=1 Tax=Edhazardia aedis (strain USNM 41457) TaxID=1003232 RepID=J9DT06_EDHAE|nr:6-phosphogluconate dehydrogenase, decarboxylating [Edhazardia aedis USNM 41457]|eukprot:EJW04447.1 6-phosphogluconate dehydrogenase, decarboxylating [Edhazardia aedis USNM 41457]